MKKLSKPTSSFIALKPNPPKAGSLKELRELQRLMAATLFRPLTPDWGMQKKWENGTSMHDVAASFIKPNDRLTSFERLEIYNRQYWYRVIDCLYDDYPGLRAVLGERRFLALCRAYLERYPSRSYTLRNLGSRLEEFLRSEPSWGSPRLAEALDMARFEWAQIVAFDGPSKPSLTVDDLLDESPNVLRLGIQPYITLLNLDHAVDLYLKAVRKRESRILRGEASNAVERTPSKKGRSSLRPPHREKLFLAVHRFDNELYYKRLEPIAYRLLSGIHDGLTLEEACLTALGSEVTETDAAQIQSWFRDWAELGWFCRPSSQIKP